MTDHPYLSRPDYCFWRRSVAGVAPADVDPVVRAPFKIRRADRIATAGSCFAQHISRHLVRNGFNYFVTESANPHIAHLSHDYNYGVFTARYGNIYTSRQLLQTMRRAYGIFTPQDDAWPSADSRMIDPYRPTIQPDGFACLDELHADRRQHLAAVRKAVEEFDILIFTLGLTETWFAKADGAVYPICPGVSGGVFDPAQHGFVNLTVGDVIQDLAETIDLVRIRNRKARFILTVSPVPLIATMEDRSVLVSTTYSKSVLRVAAEEISASHHDVSYFPSYEIINGNYTRGCYFSDGLRDVTEAGVEHVMRLFMRHYTNFAQSTPEPPAQPPNARKERAAETRRELTEAAEVMCDELLLDPVLSSLAQQVIRTDGTPYAMWPVKEITESRKLFDAWEALKNPSASMQPQPKLESETGRGRAIWSWLTGH
jgi:GSCFA family